MDSVSGRILAINPIAPSVGPARPYRRPTDNQDNIPIGDPATLFESVEYQQSGSAFWSDLNKDHRMSSPVPG